MAHLSPPPSPPNTLPSVTSKLLNYPNIMNGLDKLNFPLASSALRANLNTALQNKLSQGKRRLLSDILIRMKLKGIKSSKIKSGEIKLNKIKSGEFLKMKVKPSGIFIKGKWNQTEYNPEKEEKR